MSDSVIRDVVFRTSGEMYIGVVGPVRSGKSMFIRKFIENKVMPYVVDEDTKNKCINEFRTEVNNTKKDLNEAKVVFDFLPKIKTKNLYNYYVSIDGIEEADTYSARPGFSEHQTGLAVDIANINKTLIEENDKEFTWLKNNAHKYGFILRYQKNAEKITGYIYEPWHYRYVGTELASYIYSNNITYDEYIARNK